MASYLDETNDDGEIENECIACAATTDNPVMYGEVHCDDCMLGV